VDYVVVIGDKVTLKQIVTVKGEIPVRHLVIILESIGSEPSVSGRLKVAD